MLMSLRRQAFLIEMIDQMQSEHMRQLEAAQQQEEEQLALVLARSLVEAHGEPTASTPGTTPKPGLHATCMETLNAAHPSRPYSEVCGFFVTDESGGGAECAVCLGEFRPDEGCRILPCMHCFHTACIDKWLARVESCPTCKQAVHLTR